ncbi:MAG: hypothetical protein NT062_17700, partial [Proteobacteria bacterium]|nr:hypothetical protein [Pseudomonadota bacterium]
MHARWLLPWSLLAVTTVSACGLDAADDEDDDYSWAADDKADGQTTSNVAATHLAVDATALTAVATIDLEKNGNVALEVGGLTISAVHDDRGNRHYKIVGGKLLVSKVRGALVVDYSFAAHDHADGLLPGGSTVVWPYFCGNLFPCHSQPADGTRFSLDLEGIPAGKTAIFPATIDADAPPYMLAWAVGKYGHASLGTTTDGTEVSTSWLPNGETAARAGTKHLVGVFDWYEQTIGPYSFGQHVGAVSVVWGEGLYGGMEHHPFWHVAKDAMADEETQAHEAAHGWFGDGVRLRCWEDFVLSEVTVSYLAARALG